MNETSAARYATIYANRRRVWVVCVSLLSMATEHGTLRAVRSLAFSSDPMRYENMNDLHTTKKRTHTLIHLHPTQPQALNTREAKLHGRTRAKKRREFSFINCPLDRIYPLLSSARAALCSLLSAHENTEHFVVCVILFGFSIQFCLQTNRYLYAFLSRPYASFCESRICWPQPIR